MKHTITFIFSGIILLVLIGSCNWLAESFSYKFCRFDNSSSKKFFYAYLSIDYPDTIFHWNNRSSYERDLLFYKGQDIYFANPRNEYFKKHKTLQIFLFSGTEDRHEWNDSAQFISNFLRRYEVTREWMDEHDWTITYP